MISVAPHPLTKSTCRAFHTVALAGLFTLAFINPATAADFPGSLKGATITDAQTTNQPPVAAFTYAINGDTVTFDARGSSDPDGSILKYKWSFDDGSLAEGMTATKTLPEGTKRKVTLTVEDNTHGVALQQQTVAEASGEIYDDFSTDSSENYILASGGIQITDGVARSSQNRTTLVAIHKKRLPSIDHYAELYTYYSGTIGSGGLLFRFDDQKMTGYNINLSSNRLNLYSYNNGTKKTLAFYGGQYGQGMYRLKATIAGEVIKIYVNGILVIEKKDTTYGTGNQIGLEVNPYGDAKSVIADNLTGS